MIHIGLFRVSEVLIIQCRYRGEKLSSNSVSSSKRRKMKDVIISTVYDKPEEEETTILRTAPPTVLKHRNIQFLEGGILHQSKK